MSLKAFHVFFVATCVIFCAGFGTWAIRDYWIEGAASSLAMGLCSFFSVVLLVWYGLWFLRKLKNVSYL